MEPEEISEFAKEMKEAGEASMTRVSLIISILAVLVALVTVFSHREHTEAVLAQARASDRWGEYQGRRIRQAQLEVAEDLMAVLPSSDAAAFQSKQHQFETARERAQEKLNDDTREARALEREVGTAETKAARLDLGEALLQISVVLASITLLTRRWRYVLAALGLGGLGVLAAAAAMLVH